MINTSIVICGQKFDIGTKVVLWDDPLGFNAYDISKNIVYYQDRESGKKIKTIVEGVRYSNRSKIYRNPNFERLKKMIDQFFLHHSGLYRSADTFNVLHNQRRLSVHFILDDDGTIYQTLDLKEKAWHGGINNSQSVGIEIDSRAHAYRFPEAYNAIECKNHMVGPRRKRIDYVQNSWLMGYEYNDSQYRSLILLAIALKKIFPQMGDMKFPTENGRIIKSEMKYPKKHSGLICHYNNSDTKNDPISFDHYRLMRGIDAEDPGFGSTFLVAGSWTDRQEWLITLGYDPGPIDGVFGPQTEKAIIDFQREAKLTPDGVWGFKTDYMMDLIAKEKGLR